MALPFDIAIAWRIYPGVSKTPIIHRDSKYRLVRTSLLSFRASAAGLSISYYFILDGCPPEYEQLINEIFVGEKLTVIHTPRIGNLPTFQKQIDILLGQADAEVVYFAEDDYLYMPGEFKAMKELLATAKDVDFVSGYAANDIFTHPIHKHKRDVRYAAGKFWMTANSTCLTFMTTRTVLAATRKIFQTYVKGNNDCALWLVLTKTHILNPFAYIRYSGNKECFGILKMAVKYSFRYFLSRKYTLWVPLPAICTHLESGLETPGTDWIGLAENIDSSISLADAKE